MVVLNRNAESLSVRSSTATITLATGKSVYHTLQVHLGYILQQYLDKLSNTGHLVKGDRRRMIMAQSLQKRLHIGSDGEITFPVGKVKQDVSPVNKGLKTSLRDDIGNMVHGCRHLESLGRGMVEYRLHLSYVTRSDGKVYGVLYKRNI